MKQYFIQYHNAEKMGYLPFIESGNIDDITFDATIRNDFSFYTKKSHVEKTIGNECFLIVGVGDKNKKYYLWSFFTIQRVEKDNDTYTGYGTGFNLENPLLLNDLPDFDSFKNFCGNFGIGFQNITKHEFCKTLFAFVDNINSVYHSLLQVESNQLIMTALKLANEQIKDKERQIVEVERILRNDRRIVTLLKKAANYQCQFPGCNAVIKTKTGTYYIEVAHIKPVCMGGESILGNLIVLCPNHHKEFDYGDLSIREQSVLMVRGTLNEKYFQIDLIKT